MAGILVGTVVCSRSFSMVNSITIVLWMDTGKSGAPRPIISEKTKSGDCVTIRKAKYYSDRTIFPRRFCCRILCNKLSTVLSPSQRIAISFFPRVLVIVMDIACLGRVVQGPMLWYRH